MTVEQSVRFMAGTMILSSLILNYYFPEGYWLFFLAFIGLNLFQSALTKFCPAEIIMKSVFFKKK